LVYNAEVQIATIAEAETEEAAVVDTVAAGVDMITMDGKFFYPIRRRRIG